MCAYVCPRDFHRCQIEMKYSDRTPSAMSGTNAQTSSRSLALLDWEEENLEPSKLEKNVPLLFSPLSVLLAGPLLWISNAAVLTRRPTNTFSWTISCSESSVKGEVPSKESLHYTRTYAVVSTRTEPNHNFYVSEKYSSSSRGVMFEITFRWELWRVTRGLLGNGPSSSSSEFLMFVISALYVPSHASM